MSDNLTTSPFLGGDLSWMAVIQRAKVDFEEMPGLSLTPAQAARLWRVESHVAKDVLMAMVQAGYLSAGPYGFTRHRATA